VRETGSITDAFAAHGVADYIRQETRVSARLPDAATAARLRQGTARPALYVTSVNTDLQGTPIEYAETWFAGDRVTLTVQHEER
jgi:GntR family phosphonate transport system transcriptional regulator